MRQTHILLHSAPAEQDYDPLFTVTGEELIRVTPFVHKATPSIVLYSPFQCILRGLSTSEAHITGLIDRILTATPISHCPVTPVPLLRSSEPLPSVSSAYQLTATKYSPVLTADVQLALAFSSRLVIRPLVLLHI